MDERACRYSWFLQVSPAHADGSLEHRDALVNVVKILVIRAGGDEERGPPETLADQLGPDLRAGAHVLVVIRALHRLVPRDREHDVEHVGAEAERRRRHAGERVPAADAALKNERRSEEAEGLVA